MLCRSALSPRDRRRGCAGRVPRRVRVTAGIESTIGCTTNRCDCSRDHLARIPCLVRSIGNPLGGDGPATPTKTRRPRSSRVGEH